MEINEHYPIEGLKNVVIHLAWAQLEVFADDVEQIQVLVAGDETSVSDLRIQAKGEELLVEQPQYGINLNLTSTRWMQVCVRIPRAWQHEIHVNTISSLLSARGLNGSLIALETVSGDLRAMRITAKELKLKTISGDVRGEDLRADGLSVRGVSGDFGLNNLEVKALKCNSISGSQGYHFSKGFERVESNVVSGDVSISSSLDRINVSLRSLSGRIRTQGVSLTDDESAPRVRVSSVSADVKLISIKE